MALTTGPLMSLDASGSIAGTLVFSKWKGRNYVRQLVTPSNPKSAKQVSVRAMFGFLAQEWATLSAGLQATWQALADATTISPFNAYVSNNQARYAAGLSPGQSYPVSELDLAGVINVPTGQGGVREALIQWGLSTVNQNWGAQVHRSKTGGFTPSLSTCVGVVPDNDTGVTTFTDTPVEPGSYFYRVIPFSADGKTGSASTEITVTVQ